MLHRLAVALLLLVCILQLAAAWHDRGMACDDAYITFRFAENLHQGNGLRWNPGGPPVEGYTNLTYVLAISGLASFGIGPVPAALALATAGVLGIVLMSLLAGRSSHGHSTLALAPAFLVFATDDLRIHASRGLETCAFAALACLHLLAVSRLVAMPKPGRGAAVLAALTGTMLFLTRPDGVLISGMCWLGSWWIARRDEARRGPLALAVAIWTLSGVGYAAWKWWMFGYLLPNSFYMKHGAGAFAGVEPTLAFLRAHGVLLATSLLAFLGLRVLRRRAGALRDDATLLLSLLAASPWLLYGAKIVHEIGFSHRFCWPLVPLLATGTVRALATAPLPMPTPRSRLAEFVLLAAVLVWIAPAQFAAWRHLQTPPSSDPYTQMFLRLGKAVNDSGLADRLHLYCSHAGATPYAAKAHHIDPAGLVDDGYCLRTPPEERARYEANLQLDVIDWHLFPASPGAETFAEDARACASRYLNEWVLGLDPDLDAALRAGQANLAVDQRRDQAFAYMRILRDRATLVGEMDTGLRRWRSFVYVWRGSPHHDRLVEHLRRHVDVAAEHVDFDNWIEPTRADAERPEPRLPR